MEAMTDHSSADAPSPDHENGALRALRSIDQKAKPDLKRAIPAVVVALATFVLGNSLGGLDRATPAVFNLFGQQVVVQPGYLKVIVIVLTVIFVLAGIVATRSIGNELARVVRSRSNASNASAIRLICFIVGYATVGLAMLSLLSVDLRSLLIGGAVTGVVVGIAAQQTLANFFAGLVLLFARPYVAGERIRIRTGALGGPFDGVIITAGLMFTVVHTDEGPISLPNAGLLASAIGPVPPPESDHGPDPAAKPDTSPPPGTSPAV
jgi:small-conductance mechanosensitive channel